MLFRSSELTYVRHASGSLTCWGANNLAQLGTGKDTSGPEPVPVKWPEATPPPGNPVLSLGAEHTCAFWPAGTPWCWGGNYYGQAGVGSDKNPIATPTALALPAATTALSQGTMFGCAAGDGGAAYCWGANDYGQMGDKGSWSLLPVTVQELD